MGFGTSFVGDYVGDNVFLGWVRGNVSLGWVRG